MIQKNNKKITLTLVSIDSIEYFNQGIFLVTSNRNPLTLIYIKGKNLYKDKKCHRTDAQEVYP